MDRDKDAYLVPMPEDDAAIGLVVAGIVAAAAIVIAVVAVVLILLYA